MAFTYNFSQHFSYPATITSNISYNGVTGILKSPFLGQSINDNFFYLACSAVDNTTRITNLEAKAITVSGTSTNLGYVSYTGLTDSVGTFYGGQPLVISGTVSSGVTLPYTLSNTAKLSFQVAVGSGIQYNLGYINTSTTNYRTITLGDTGAGSPYTSIASLLTYMNNKLVANTKDAYSYNMTYHILGNANPGANASLTGASSFPTKYFYLYINDGYY